MLQEYNETEGSVNNSIAEGSEGSMNGISVRITTTDKEVIDAIVDLTELTKVFAGEYPLDRKYIQCTKLDYAIGIKKKFLFFPEKFITYTLSEEKYRKKDKFIKKKTAMCYITNRVVNLQSYHIKSIEHLNIDICDTKQIAITTVMHLLQAKDKMSYE